MSIIIREATPQDAEAISKLNRDAMGYEYSVEETVKKLQLILSGNHDKVFVAVQGGVVVGYIHSTDYEVLYIPSMKNIMGIAVDSNCRRCGIGRSLISAVEIWAKDTGAVAIRLNSGAMRKEAHVF